MYTEKTNLGYTTTMQIEIKDNRIFAPLKKAWLKLTVEEKLRQEFIYKLIHEYGYDSGQMQQEVEIKKGIFADIAIWKNSADLQKNNKPSIIIAIECKAEHVSIRKEDILEKYHLASIINTDFFIATNLKETKVFKIKKELLTKEFEDLKDLPKANQIVSSDAIRKFIDETKSFSKDEFSKLLHKCHNIIRNNDKLSPESSFDEISKILFMKIMYERKPDKELLFTWDNFLSREHYYKTKIEPTLKEENPNYNKSFIQFEFDDTKRKFKDDKLFENNDIIRIKRNSFEMIVKELEAFNLSSTSEDIKGIAFEEFLGKTFRGELGQFFTPRTIVDFMVEVLDPQEDEKICDPCCGSGGFLIKVFDHIKEKIETDILKSQLEIESLSLNKNKSKQIELKSSIIQQLHTELDITNNNSRLRHLSYNCIYGVDANPRMARTAKMNMIMHGDGHGGVHHHDGLLDVNGIYDGRFDVILTNPPFGSRIDKSQVVTGFDLPSDDEMNFYIEKYGNDYKSNVINKLQSYIEYNNGKGKPLLDIFELGKSSSLTEVLFLERCLNLLKPGGRMGVVLPEGVLNNTNLQKVRDYVESKAKIILIVSIPQDVFTASGANVKPSLLFIKKFTEEEADLYLSTSLKAEEKITNKYKLRIDIINSKLALKGDDALSAADKKKLRSELKQVEETILLDIKLSIKEEFNYEIPIAEIGKAGISSTGAPIDNELKPLAKEFTKYRHDNNLWLDNSQEIIYKIEDNILKRIKYLNGLMTNSVTLNYPE